MSDETARIYPDSFNDGGTADASNARPESLNHSLPVTVDSFLTSALDQGVEKL
jgi:hypothetical protein